MQQTKKYQLNKPEMGDTFSTAPLNENMDKVEGALEAVRAEAAAGDAALAGRVTALEAKKIVVGSYTGNGSDSGQTIRLGFMPIAVFIQNHVDNYNSYTYQYLLTANNPAWDDVYSTYVFKLVDSGFHVSHGLSGSWNVKGEKYHFIAFG